MAQHSKLKFLHSPSRSYPSLAQGNYVGAQSTAGRRGTLPAFDDTNSYFISKTGSDANAGTAAAPKLTLGSLFSTTQSFNDTSGNARNLTQTGTVPVAAFPCAPIPAQGNYSAGPFSDANYLNCPAGLCTAMSSDTFTFEGWIYMHTLPTNSKFFANTTGTVVDCAVDSAGQLVFTIAATSLTSPASVVVGKWYYVAFAYTSGASSGKKIYLGETPETAVVIASATQTQAITGLSGAKIGNAIIGGAPLDGYVDRLVFSTVARTSFPTLPTDSSIAGMYEMETRPLMQTAPKDYIVIADSETYDEVFDHRFQHDILAGFGIYAADGETPTFALTRGATVGTFGSGNGERVKASSTVHYTINSTTGNDGTGSRDAGGTGSGNPFRTIQAALSHGSRAASDVFEIQDSATYLEDLTLGTLSFTLQAATNQVPTLQPRSRTTGSNHMSATGALTAIFSGLNLFAWTTSLQYLLDPAANAAVVKLYDCTAKDYVNLNKGSVATTLSLYDCYVVVNPGSAVSALSAGTGAVVAWNTSFNGSLANYTTYVERGYLSLANGTDIKQCTFTKLWVENYARSASPAKVDRCVFTDSAYHGRSVGVAGVRMYNSIIHSDVTIETQFTYVNIGESYAISMETNADTQVQSNLVLNCHVVFDAGFVTPAAKVSLCIASTKVPSGPNSTIHTWVVDCSGVRSTVAITWAGVGQQKGLGKNSTSVRCESSGQGVSDVTQAIFEGALDSGSPDGLVSAGPVLYSRAEVTILNNDLANANIAPYPDQAAIAAGNAKSSVDCGYSYALFDITMADVVLNGLTFSSALSREGGVKSSASKALTAAFCTFSEIGIFGVTAPSQSSVTDCLFSNAYGHCLKVYGSNVSAARNVAANAGGVFLLNAGQGLSSENNSAYGCLYGQYDKAGSFSASLVDCIYAGSSSYDYSGDDSATYSCIGTLDPDRQGTLDASSLRLDPLFRDPANGDLRLMAIAAGSEFDSPCIAAGSVGADMGAFAFTYGSCELSWIEIDFATVSPSGANYRNPDKLTRELIGVKLAENDREDGKFDSDAVAYKLQYTCAWSEPNDMPLEQLIELVDMFKSTSNEIHVCIDGAWIAARLVRGPGFQYEENSELGYTEASIPTPLRTLTFREE